MRLVCADALLEAERGFKSDLIPDSSTEIMVELNGAELKHARYAILSHCWGVPDEGQKEVQFREMSELLSMNGTIRNEVRRRTGYMKILETCRRAREDGLDRYLLHQQREQFRVIRGDQLHVQMVCRLRPMLYLPP